MPRPRRSAPVPEAAQPPRIIGGELRGRKLAFVPAGPTRPMKDRVRETLFDLLGPSVRGCLAVDLFAGTGALGFEAASRGAARVVLVERHFPTADALRRTAADLGIADRVEVRAGDALAWGVRMPDVPRDRPWVVFVSPPWSFFQARLADLLALVTAVRTAAPAGSTLVVESDGSLDVACLPDPERWRTHAISPATLHLLTGLVS